MDKAKRDAIAARLEKIATLNGGRITPDAVLKDAKSPASPLHDQFEWDDSAAGKQWRLMQARDLIRSVRVEVTTESRVVSTVRYVRDPTAGGEEQGYVEVAKLRDSRELAREALTAELKSAQALFERAHSLAEALGLSEEFEDLRHRVELLRGQLAEAA
jgi:hypothetical protein